MLARPNLLGCVKHSVSRMNNILRVLFTSVLTEIASQCIEGVA